MTPIAAARTNMSSPHLFGTADDTAMSHCFHREQAIQLVHVEQLTLEHQIAIWTTGANRLLRYLGRDRVAEVRAEGRGGCSAAIEQLPRSSLIGCEPLDTTGAEHGHGFRQD